MATEKQISANRLNSQKSTGPRTDAGKSITRLNALKSGIHAQSHVIRGEDPEALAHLAAEYNSEFRPATPRQRDLVDTLVHNEWKIRRLRAIETDLWQYRFESNDMLYSKPDDSHHIRLRKHALRTAFDDLEDRLERLQRRLHAYERSTQRTLKELREQSGAGASACQPAEGRQVLDEPPASPQTGFVPSNPVEQASTLAGPPAGPTLAGWGGMPAFEPACPGESFPHPLPRIGFVPTISANSPR
jgi:hypothetical protein